ncbi:hypothetical protein [Dethiobacter alkaliphilus]|uniref:hypothetical protein n=1 Tax=Dethiobacter alkaliphilus TaxID=427926 RepID=UPI0022269F2F|nr:hypothetical protein [Dethiobacter alkaliphilus]MCW3491322.1 hypothetical protein [Dethiobacter alkaliphilus]
MKKLNKKVILIILIAVFAAGGTLVFMLFSGGDDSAGSVGTGVVQSGRSGFPVDERDARIYSTIEQYLSAQAENQRDSVVRMLTEEHRKEWTDESFLLTEAARDAFDEITTENLKLGVIRYENQPGGIRQAIVFTEYDLVFINGEEVDLKVEVAEDLMFTEVDGEWLLSSNNRMLAEADI